MQLPTISEYENTLSEPQGLFRTLGDLTVERDRYGELFMIAGNNSVVFRIVIAGETFLLKCYTKKEGPDRDLYRLLSQNSDPLLAPVKLLENEIYVYDPLGEPGYYDVVIAPWAEGSTLDTELSIAAREGDTAKLQALSRSFEQMASSLLERPWAHGDLKPENIIVSPSGQMTLVDYDAMWYSELSSGNLVEVGTPGFQHPLRGTGRGKYIDDYSIALIAASIRALASEPSLYSMYHRSDNILAYPAEIVAGQSEAWHAILRTLASVGDHAGYALALKLRSDSPIINGLDENILSTRLAFKAQMIPYRNFSLWGYSDQTGSLMTEAIFDEAGEFREGFSVVTLCGIKQIIDCEGNILVNGGFEEIKPFSEGLAAVCKNELWGYIDTSGQIIIEPVYQMASSIHEGFAAVKMSEGWDYINKEGHLVTNFSFDYARSIRNSRAEAGLNEKIFIISIKGETVSVTEAQ